MKLAVLMSTYNGENYIAQQLDSILAQTLDVQLDIWVRDDGSKDGTTAILQQYADAGKLRWYTGENLKPAKSFLDLLNHCPGYDFYSFADQDDFWYPEKLHSAVSALQETSGPAMYFANARLVGGNLAPLGRDVYRNAPRTDFTSLLCNGGILGCTMVLNAALAQALQNAPVPETIIMHDAYAAIVCAMLDGRIFYDATARMDYRQHGSNVVGSNWNKLDALKDRVRKITTRQKISIADQAQSILRCFPELPDGEKRAFLIKVANYRKSVFSAIGLACSRKYACNSRNMAITLRLSALLRNC